MLIKVEKNKKNILQCRCKFCPSYSVKCLIKAMPQMTKAFIGSKKKLKQETHLENLFCAFDSSKCIKNKKGCKCPTCPVYKRNKLDSSYYCLRNI